MTDEEAEKIKEKMMLDKIVELMKERDTLREALVHVSGTRRLDRYNCTLEAVQKFSLDVLEGRIERG